MPKAMLVASMAVFLLLGGTVVSTAHATPLAGATTLPSTAHTYSPVELARCVCGPRGCACGRVWKRRHWRCWRVRGRRVCGWRYY